jgi:hypothetical protein
MRANMTGIEKTIRILLGLVCAYLGFGAVVTGTLGYVLQGLAIYLVLTGFIAWDPIYSLLGVGKKKKK